MGNLSVSAKGFETMLGVGWFFENWDFWAEAAKQEVSVDKWAVNRLGVVIHNETLDFTDFANQHLDLQVGLDIWKLRVKGGRQINSRVHLALGVEWGMLQPKGSLAADELAAKALKHARVDLQGTTEKLRGVINLPVVVPEVHIRGGRWVISTKLLWNYLAQEDWICGAEVKWSLSF